MCTLIKVRLFWVSIGFVVAAAAQTGPSLSREGAYWVETDRATLSSVEGIESLHVKALGNVSLRGVDEDSVAYTLKKRVRAHTEAEALRLLKSHETVASRNGTTLELRFVCRASHRGLPELALTVPRTLIRTYLGTSWGNIDATGLQGSLRAESGGGRIFADEIGRGVQARTVGGAIQLGRIEGFVTCSSGAGNLEVQRAGGELWFETAGGEIRVAEVVGEAHMSTGGGNIRVGRAGGSVFAGTKGGSIEVGAASGSVIAKTGNGSIRVNGAAGVQCESAGGAIWLRGVSGTLRASTVSGIIVAELRGESPLGNSFLYTGYGDIKVLIPSNLAVTVRAFSTPSPGGGRIVSDFPEVQVDEASRRGFEPLFARGKINGGGPLLKVSTADGTVYLRRH